MNFPWNSPEFSQGFHWRKCKTPYIADGKTLAELQKDWWWNSEEIRRKLSNEVR